MQLHAKWKYNVRGPKLRSLRIELPGWEIDAVSSDSAGIGQSRCGLGNRGTVSTIPLAAASRRTIRYYATGSPDLRRVPESDLSFVVPRPHGDTVNQAIVAVLPADNVELSPRADAMTRTCSPIAQAPDHHQIAGPAARSLVLPHRRARRSIRFRNPASRAVDFGRRVQHRDGRRANRRGRTAVDLSGRLRAGRQPDHPRSPPFLAFRRSESDARRSTAFGQRFT